MSFLNAVSYIDKIEPEHFRTSCKDHESYNSAFVISGQLYNKCNRCTLLAVAQLACGIIEPESDED